MLGDPDARTKINKLDSSHYQFVPLHKGGVMAESSTLHGEDRVEYEPDCANWRYVVGDDKATWDADVDRAVNPGLPKAKRRR